VAQVSIQWKAWPDRGSRPLFSSMLRDPINRLNLCQGDVSPGFNTLPRLPLGFFARRQRLASSSSSSRFLRGGAVGETVVHVAGRSRRAHVTSVGWPGYALWLQEHSFRAHIFQIFLDERFVDLLLVSGRPRRHRLKRTRSCGRRLRSLSSQRAGGGQLVLQQRREIRDQPRPGNRHSLRSPTMLSVCLSVIMLSNGEIRNICTAWASCGQFCLFRPDRSHLFQTSSRRWLPRRFGLSDNLAGSLLWVGEGGGLCLKLVLPVPSAWQPLGEIRAYRAKDSFACAGTGEMVTTVVNFNCSLGR